jgi:glycerophosphoryl diester phosphodiesterase
MTTPIVIAHRGDAQNQPENSLAAFEVALAGGVRHVECDLQRNASGTLVVLHDADLRRTHGCDLSVFDHVDGQAPILPTARDVLALAAARRDATFIFEIKHDSIDRWGEDEMIEALEPLLAGFGPHVILCRSLTFAAKARAAGFAAIGVLVREWSEETRQQLAALEPDYLVTNIRRVPDGEPLWAGNWQWAVYEVGDAESAIAWANRGAAFVISFNAVELHEQLQARRP